MATWIRCPKTDEFRSEEREGYPTIYKRRLRVKDIIALEIKKRGKPDDYDWLIIAKMNDGEAFSVAETEGEIDREGIAIRKVKEWLEGRLHKSPAIIEVFEEIDEYTNKIMREMEAK